MTNNTKRLQSIYSSPVAWSGIDNLLLPRITDSTKMTVTEVNNKLSSWTTNYPSQVNVNVMGQTVQSRDQKIVRLFDDGVKPIIGISCGIHGNEIESLRGWISSIDWILSSNDSIAQLVRNKLTIYFVPLFNVDGAQNNTRNNANNVNLNRNWPYFFDLTTDIDKGSSALSEPETNNFVTYMLSDSKVSRAIGWIDAHAWSSRTTFGFLTEKRYYKQNSNIIERSFFNHTNTILKKQNYTPQISLTEYLSSQNSYLYNWVISNGDPSCWGCIIEFPQSQTNATNSNVAQDCFMGFILAALQKVSDPKQGTISESETVTTTLNSNPSLVNWSSTEPRPQFFSGSKVKLFQEYDSILGRNVARVENPLSDQLSYSVVRPAYTSTVGVGSTDPLLYVIGGENSSGTNINTVISFNYKEGKITSCPNFLISATEMAATNDGKNVYVGGGFTTGYVNSMYKSTGITSSIGFSTYLSSLSVYNQGIQRHSMNNWNNGTTINYLIISGGRDSVGYKTAIYAVDTQSSYIWRIGNTATARGWHTSAIYADKLYVFGGWTGSTYLSSVEYLSLTDNKIATGTGATVTGNNTFTVSGYSFTSADIGRIITIQGSSNQGEYTIGSIINSSSVGLSSTTPVSNTSGHAYVISSSPTTAITTTSLPGSRRQQLIAQDSNYAYLFGGVGIAGIGTTSSLYRYNMSTNSVTTLSYTLDSYVDDESGNVVTIETPNLYSSSGYFDSSSSDIVILGGGDETGIARSDIYKIDVVDLVCSINRVSPNDYGYLRMTQVFSSAKSVLVATLRNLTAVNNTFAPYIRLTILVGPLTNITRKIRSWYQVPPYGEYETFSMPFELKSGETEYRCYIRFYTPNTTLRVSNFQLFDLKDKHSYPIPITGGKQPDNYTCTLSGRDCHFGDNKFAIEGEIVPQVGVGITISEVPVLEFYDVQNTLLFSLMYSSISSAIDDTLGTGTLKLKNYITNTSQSQTSFEINYTRSEGKVMRYDIMSWRLVKEIKTLTLKLSYYGDILDFPITGLDSTYVLKTIKMFNGIFSNPVSVTNI